MQVEREDEVDAVMERSRTRKAIKREKDPKSMAFPQAMDVPLWSDVTMN